MPVDNSSVKVAVRIRPLVESEISKGCRNVLNVVSPIQQIQIKDNDKAFTFNYVFDTETKQEDLYKNCVANVLESLFEGYNVTILAYGQTGSGKTHTMGTAYKESGDMGIIPFAVNDIFTYIRDNFSSTFTVTVSFLELYNETLYDLLSLKSRDQCIVEMREDQKGSIVIPNLTEQTVESASETFKYLIQGSEQRTTGSTNMNSQSSRSHAIFTLSISMHNKNNSNISKTAKFVLVDLAGSERQKKTGATGQTFREGININKGLLVLGNVISALGDEKLQHGHIPYRDSNLTRLLKDSLGGNSITLMIACISPADYNLDETLSTLRYADRARKIRNKPVVNQDEKTAEIARLNDLVRQLRLELMGQGGPIISQNELHSLENENKDLKSKNKGLTVKLYETLQEKMSLLEKMLIIQDANEKLNSKLQELRQEYDETLNNLNLNLESNNIEEIRINIAKLHSIQEHINQIDTEQKEKEGELRHHEISTAATRIYTNQNAGNETEISEKEECHTAQQIAMNEELQDITKKLAMKEHLARQLAENIEHLEVYNNVIDENESKITALEKEKADLLQQLKSIQICGATSKIAEQRRKRVQELETQIQDLKKKVQEQARLIKLRVKDEQKIKQLNNEIISMKQVKVKLIKGMRQESEKFRTWKIQRERELIKLNDRDRKRQNQILKMETMLSRQQNVLKRKVEEVAAINKRLKDALALRKATHDYKYGLKEDRLGEWLKREIEVHVSTIEAESTLNSLLDDRSVLQKQLNELESNQELNDITQIKQLKEDIELRCVQISSLQQKLLDSNDENKTRTRWDSIQTMSEAKHILNNLFTYIGEFYKDKYKGESKTSELKQNYNEVQEKIIEYERKLKQIEHKHQSELSEIHKESEEKIGVLLRQLRGVEVANTDDEVKKTFSIIQEKSDNLEKENEELKETIAKLHKTIEMINDVATEKSYKTPPHNATYCLENKKNYSEMDEDEDDVLHDPDWRKTPLARRIQRFKEEPSILTDKATSKRTSEGGCMCKTNCSKKVCGCKKTGNHCTSKCKCQEKCCTNRSNLGEEVSSTSIEDNTDTGIFKLPEPVEDTFTLSVPKKSKFRREPNK